MRQPRHQSILRFPGCWLVVVFSFVRWSGFAADRTGVVAATDPIKTTATRNENDSSIEQTVEHQPLIYTYFEKIDDSVRTTGMTDDEDFDLLQLWRERWEEAGYKPVILTAEDADALLGSWNKTKHEGNNHSFAIALTKERSDSIRTKLEDLPLDHFGKVLFRRWMAMAAVGGGWFSDYDNFPLWNFSQKDLKQQLPNDAKITVHDILSPTLASGSGSEWVDTLEALLDEANRSCTPKSIGDNVETISSEQNGLARGGACCCFYTDSLGIHSLIANHHTLSPKSSRKVARPFDKNDPVSLDDPRLCSAREFRTKLTIHFGPEALQRGRYVTPNARLPRHRSRLARDWLDRWKVLCHTNGTYDSPLKIS